MTGFCSSRIERGISREAVFIIGAGHFGSRAATLICRSTDVPVFVIDIDKESLSGLGSLPVNIVIHDGIDFLVENFHLLDPAHTIVPALPLHLASEWLERHFRGLCSIEEIPVPEEISPLLPYTWPGSGGSLLVSYADFVCPDDCPEPEYCTTTGEKRYKPLYGLLGDLVLPEFRVHIITSRQLAPGLGGVPGGRFDGSGGEIGRGKAGKVAHWYCVQMPRCSVGP